MPILRNAYPAAEKTQRRWRWPAAAAIHRTAEAEAQVMLRADRTSTAARLAPIARGMQLLSGQPCLPCRVGKVRGWNRLGMVDEARGDNQKAADCYRKVIDFIRAHPDD
jgi:hypothetical protein